MNPTRAVSWARRSFNTEESLMMSECVSRFLTALGQWCAHQGHLTIISTESTNPPNRTPATSFAVCLPHVGAQKFCSCPEVLARPTLVGARLYRPGRGSLPQLQPIAKLARPSDHACNHLCITDLRCPKTARHTKLRRVSQPGIHDDATVSGRLMVTGYQMRKRSTACQDSR